MPELCLSVTRISGSWLDQLNACEYHGFSQIGHIKHLAKLLWNFFLYIHAIKKCVMYRIQTWKLCVGACCELLHGIIQRVGYRYNNILLSQMSFLRRKILSKNWICKFWRTGGIVGRRCLCITCRHMFSEDIVQAYCGSHRLLEKRNTLFRDKRHKKKLSSVTCITFSRLKSLIGLEETEHFLTNATICTSGCQKYPKSH